MKSNHSKLQKLLPLLLMLALLSGLIWSPASLVTKAADPVESFIVQAKSADEAATLVQQYGGQVTSRLHLIHGVAAQMSPSAAASLRSQPGISVTPNATTKLTQRGWDKPNKKGPESDYPDVIGADQAWEQGITGKGVTVAVVDTGIDSHPALNKGLDGKNRKLLGWVDFIDGKKTPKDPNGHGTHIAGIIANTAIGTDNEWMGIAPGVDLVGVRVLDETGTGTYESVIQGIQWVVDHKDEYNIKVLNLSLHAVVQSPYWADPLNQAVMRAWAEGLVVVVAAGNSGPGPLTISVPGNTPYVITVGAFTDNYTPDDWTDDTITPFSAAGPTLDNFVKPDVIAPGAHMVSTMMPGSYIAKNHQANWIEKQYFSMAGTSQAAAVVSGLSALVLEQNPELNPDQVKYRLMFTALPWVNEDASDALYSIWQQGTGRLNAPDAIFKAVNGSANQGLDVWADLDGRMHYEGYTTFDSTTGQFRLQGEYGELLNSGLGAWSGGLGAWSGSHYAAWADGLGAWSGGLGAWSGGLGAWSGGLGAWSGGLGAWSGGLGAWSGGLGAWSGGYTAYADGLGAWSGGLGAWSGGLGAWSGGLGAWSGSAYLDPDYMEVYADGSAPSVSNADISVSPWVDEPQP